MKLPSIRGKMKNKFTKNVVIWSIVVVTAFAPIQVSASTNQNIDKFMEALKSAQPLKIEAARKKYVASNSSADLFSKIIVNHFNATEYLKTLDKYGNVSPSAHDAPGLLKKSKSGNYYLDSTFDTIDGNYRKFKFNKSGKITSFEFKNNSSSYKSIQGSLQNLTINYFDSGTEIKSGIHWKLPNNYSFVQVNYSNKFGGFKSWSYARGYIRDASGVNHDVKTGPLGCTNSGGNAVIEGTTSTEAAIVKGTTSVFVIPMYSDCSGSSSNPINVPFLVQ
jgi:hypothetical protein